MTAADDLLNARLVRIVADDPDLMALLRALRALAQPPWRVTAGCLYQTVWNVLTGRPRGTGIKDYDVVYFDADDLSWEAEDRVIRRVVAALPALPVPVEIRNQARVHLWFEKRFGAPYPPLRHVDDGLVRYASTVHAVSVRLEADGTIDVAAPFGLADVFDMVIRPNPAIDNAPSYAEKAARAKAIWPDVRVIAWSA
ncbi:MAG: nucleotidyltransferase family protein [Rhodospirillales bacterium]